jgi:hypothetical protein
MLRHRVLWKYVFVVLTLGVLFVAYVLTATNPLAPASGQATYDFSFGAAGGRHVAVGHNLYVQLQIALTTGTAQKLRFQVTGLPAGVSYSFPDLEATCCGAGTGAYEYQPISTTLLLRASPSTPTGSYTVQVTATSGGVSHNISYPFVVEPVPAAPTAVPITAQTAIPSLAQWESQMTEWGTNHCNATTIMNNSSHEGGVWYYDGERVYFQIADYTGDPKWNACAVYVKAMYRDTYVIPNSGKVPGWRNFTHGLAMDYLRNGDAQSKNAALLLSDNASYASNLTPFFYVIGAGASRETAYAIHSYLNAEKVGAPARARLAQYVDIALGHLDQWFVSKTYRCPPCGAGAQPGDFYIQPFMAGLTAEALIGYYQKTQDPRIFPAVKTAMDWLWANAWVPADRGFWYENFVSDPSQPFPAAPGAPGLNLLIAPAYAWLYQMTGDTQYRDQGDQIFAGGVATVNTSQAGAAYLPIGKQFSQNYRWSFDYVTWRTALSGGTPPPPDTTPPTVSFTSPDNDVIVSGTITVSASASDNVGVAGVRFALDGVILGAEVTAAPYAFSWDTALATNGAHSLAAVARDAAGNTASANITVTLKNATPQ